MVSARVPSRSKMNARSGFAISVDSEKKQPTMSSAGGGCRLVGRVPSCPTCQTEYPPGTEVCPRDGAPLTLSSGTPEGFPHPPATGSGEQSSPAPTRSDPAVVIGSAPTLPEGPGSAVAAAAATATKAQPEERFDSLLGVVLAGRYEVLRRIGEGGVGAVYEAKHTHIGKRVAVKVLLEKFHAQSDLVARLLQEARLASSIGHENIIDITDFGTTDDGRTFVVMEFLDGESLAQVIEREGALAPQRAIAIVRQVASALGAAHGKRVVHRDVKPENVFITQRGEKDFVKVGDFGISKDMKPDDGSDGTGMSPRPAQTGVVLGTPLYMSPEQARGEDDLDHRIDIYALGTILYETL